MSRKLAYALVYQWGIQIYAQISIPRSWSKLKLHRAFPLDLDLKGAKMAQNVTKVGVLTCLPMGHPNLCSNFNSEKLVKAKTSLSIFARVRLKGAENGSECRESWHACLPMGHPNLFSNFNSEKLVKPELTPYVFARLGNKGGEYSSERHKICRACLSTNGASKSMLKFQLREVGQS
jgi:hypothetical protein